MLRFLTLLHSEAYGSWGFVEEYSNGVLLQYAYEALQGICIISALILKLVWFGLQLHCR